MLVNSTRSRRNLPEILDTEKNTEAVYRSLVRCYGHPGSSLIEAVAELRSAFRDSDHEIFEHLSEMQSGITREGIQALQVEYARLFVGPFKLVAPPYGSVYLENARQVMGVSTVAVIEEYRAAGLLLRDDFKDAPDHIATELEFVQFLSHLIAGALEGGELETAQDASYRRSTFLRKHLGAWVPRFTQKVIENSRSEFYKNLAWITRSIVLGDLSSIEEYATESDNH